MKVEHGSRGSGALRASPPDFEILNLQFEIPISHLCSRAAPKSHEGGSAFIRG